MITSSSKMTLKMSCLAACDNDVAKAERLYDFIVKDIADLPDFDQPKPTIMQQIKTGADDLFGWLDAHGNDLAKGWNFIQSIRNGAPIQPTNVAPPTDIPPLPQQ